MRPPLPFRTLAAILLITACVSYSRWADTGHVAELPCGGDIGVRPADLSTDDEVDDWGVTCQVRTPLLEPCSDATIDGGAQ